MSKIISRIADYIRETDRLLLVFCLAATLLGSVEILSVTNRFQSIRPFAVQIISLFFGIAAAILISMFDFDTILKRWYIVAAIGIIPVILTFFIGFAPGETDDKAWLDLKFTTFQPSELLKICFIVTFSAHISKIKENINKLKYLIPLVLHGLFPIVLIHIQGDDGTALVFAIMFLCMIIAAGISWKYIVAAVIAAVIASPIIYFFIMNEDQRKRIIGFTDINADIKNTTYQQFNARKALANGGFFGQGLFKGPLTQSGAVPEARNDFIFVSIGEELGFLGCLAVILLLAAICFRCIYIAHNCRKDSGKIICIGFFSMIFAQIIINIGMCTALLPVIGITLPFFSSGGTSLLCVFLGVGLVMSVYLHRNSRLIYLHD
ncbi:MAG: FtsW/RodA/SpoVE family cell cycle protein [Clostridia bacterium]|nr:FtsW/RodA/SpoVE family cell cycle protein [Clostridia bacterium]